MSSKADGEEKIDSHVKSLSPVYIAFERVLWEVEGEK